MWLDAAIDEAASVERLKGGGYNRIIGLATQTKRKPETRVKYILRIPRFRYCRLEDDVAALRFVNEHTNAKHRHV